MFTLTSAAAQQILQAASTSGAQDMALRIAARPEADGSIQYGMGFDDPHDSDMKLDLHGVAVVIAEQHREHLEDTVLDFVELEPAEFKFIFIPAQQPQPEPVQAAGCGSGGCGSCGNAR